MKLYVLIVSLLLTGCATTAKYEQMLESWIGAPEKELIYAWGVPVRSYSVDNNLKFLTFRDDRTLYIPGGPSTSYTKFYGNSMTTTTYGNNAPTTLGLTCETTFGIRYGLVVSYRYEGNNCVTNETPPQM